MPAKLDHKRFPAAMERAFFEHPRLAFEGKYRAGCAGVN
jgi:hypothetical protein